MVIYPPIAIPPPQLRTWTSWLGTAWCSLSSTPPVLCAAHQGTTPSSMYLPFTLVVQTLRISYSMVCMEGMILRAPYITPYYPILPHTTSYYPMQPHTTPYYPVLPQTTPYYLVLPHTTPYYPILLHTTPYYPYYPVLPHTTPYYLVLPQTTPYYPILPHTTPCYPYYPEAQTCIYTQQMALF